MYRLQDCHWAAVDEICVGGQIIHGQPEQHTVLHIHEQHAAVRVLGTLPFVGSEFMKDDTYKFDS
jgi:hypothetical protein